MEIIRKQRRMAAEDERQARTTGKQWKSQQKTQGQRKLHKSGGVQPSRFMV